jgi:hypothetical protein
MSTVQQDFKRRLARAEITVSAVHPADLRAASHRKTLRMRATICEFIRERFLLMGLDPALAVSLHIGEDAAAELAAIPDTEALRTADEAITHSDLDDAGEAASSFNAKIQRMVADYSEGAQPDFARASVAQLFAFCLANKKLAWDRLPSSKEKAGLPEASPRPCARRRVNVSRVFRNSGFARLGGGALGIAVFKPSDPIRSITYRKLSMRSGMPLDCPQSTRRATCAEQGWTRPAMLAPATTSCGHCPVIRIGT